MANSQNFTTGGISYEVDIFQLRGAWTLAVRDDGGDCIHRLDGLPSKSDAKDRAAAYRNRMVRAANPKPPTLKQIAAALGPCGR